MKNLIITVTLSILTVSCSLNNVKISPSEEDNIKLLYSMLYAENGEKFYRKEIEQIIEKSKGESRFIANGIYLMKHGKAKEAADQFLKISPVSPNYELMIRSFHHSLLECPTPSKYAADKLAIAIFETPYREKLKFNIHDCVYGIDHHYLEMLKDNPKKKKEFESWLKKNSQGENK